MQLHEMFAKTNPLKNFKQNAGHGGFHQFRICNADGIEDPQNVCFEGNVLQDITDRTKIRKRTRKSLETNKPDQEC